MGFVTTIARIAVGRFVSVLVTRVVLTCR